MCHWFQKKIKISNIVSGECILLSIEAKTKCESILGWKLSQLRRDDRHKQTYKYIVSNYGEFYRKDIISRE